MTRQGKSRWQQEFDALPEWAQKMVRSLAGCGCYGSGNEDRILAGMSADAKEKYSCHFLAVRTELSEDWFDGFCEMRELAAAMTAPWPPPPPPARERRAANLVEFLADPEDCGFDQPCAFGNRVESHAVYCHNEAWPDSPRKCHRNRSDYKHEDCPGFVANSAHGSIELR